MEADELRFTTWMRYSRRRGWLQVIRVESGPGGRRLVWRTLAEAEASK